MVARGQPRYGGWRCIQASWYGTGMDTLVVQGTCRNGHTRTPENTRIENGRLRCRTCKHEHRMANLAKYNEASRLNQIEYRAKLKARVYQQYGGKCAHCGYDGPDWEIDHVEGDGNQHRRDVINQKGSGNHFYLWLQRNGWPTDPPLQILCVPCHAIKSKAERTGV